MKLNGKKANQFLYNLYILSLLQGKGMMTVLNEITIQECIPLPILNNSPANKNPNILFQRRQMKLKSCFIVAESMKLLESSKILELYDEIRINRTKKSIRFKFFSEKKRENYIKKAFEVSKVILAHDLDVNQYIAHLIEHKVKWTDFLPLSTFLSLKNIKDYAKYIGHPITSYQVKTFRVKLFNKTYQLYHPNQVLELFKLACDFIETGQVETDLELDDDEILCAIRILSKTYEAKYITRKLRGKHV